LDIAAIHAGRLSVELTTTDLVPVLNESFEVHEPLASAAGIMMRKELMVESARSRCDRDRLFQALSNLLGNAIKFCRRGDRITLRAEQRANELVVAVADTGPGIQKEDL